MTLADAGCSLVVVIWVAGAIYGVKINSLPLEPTVVMSKTTFCYTT